VQIEQGAKGTSERGSILTDLTKIRPWFGACRILQSRG
jgi:hypothetical protein